MTLIIRPEPRRALVDQLARDPARRGFRIGHTGGCGALRFHLHDLDGARIAVGAGEDDIVIVHDHVVVGGAC